MLQMRYNIGRLEQKCVLLNLAKCMKGKPIIKEAENTHILIDDAN